jgi:hypothetical protein
MNEASVGQYINSYVFSVGRRLVTIQRIEEIARDSAERVIAEQAQAAMVADRACWQLTRKWERARKKDEGTRVDALEIDRSLDRGLSGAHRIANGYLHSLQPGDEQYDVSLEFNEKFFPDGVDAISKQPYEEELVDVEAMIGHWQTDWAPRVATIGLTSLASRIATLTMQYRDAITTVTQRDITWDEVRAADRQGQENMLRLVARILGDHNTDSPDDVELRTRYLATFNDQNRRIAELRIRSAVVPDVDPATGEELTDEDFVAETAETVES